MKISWFLLCVCLIVSCASISKRQTVDGDAVILESDSVSSSPSKTRIFKGNPALTGAAVGLGVGVVGTLLLGKLLEDKKCNSRGRRDTPSTRFLPGVPDILGGKKCPPTHYQDSYQSPQSSYNNNQPYNNYQSPQSSYNNNRPSQSSYNNYQTPQSSYNNNRPYQSSYNTYQPPQNNYQPPQSSYNSYKQPYQQSSNVYHHPPTASYHPPIPPINPPYQTPYRQVGRSAGSGYSQTAAVKPTPATLKRGVRLAGKKDPLLSAFQSGKPDKQAGRSGSIHTAAAAPTPTVFKRGLHLGGRK